MRLQPCGIDLGPVHGDDLTVETTIYKDYPTHVLVPGKGKLPVLFACDHASPHIPDELNKLGVVEELLHDHIAWDIGAADVARELGRLLEAPVVLATHSRLVVDCNRNLDDPTAFPAVSDGVQVPGNAGLSADERMNRANAFFWPYHHAVRDELRRLEEYASAPALIGVHSFTPEMGGYQRPWHIGALWDKDERLARGFMNELANKPEVVVGDNEPYSGRHPADFTLDHHAEAEGLPHLGIEVRQDLIDTEAGAIEWAGILAEALFPVLEDDNLYTHRAGVL
ncbi:MAG: N-formylglutamate amidohydrolase [Gammaproteobacteria bacterium]